MEEQETIAAARHRLEVVVSDTVTEELRSIRRLSAADRFALISHLHELHRMNEVANQLRKENAELPRCKACAAKRRK